mgnify:CR=1 FL=1
MSGANKFGGKSHGYSREVVTRRRAELSSNVCKSLIADFIKPLLSEFKGLVESKKGRPVKFVKWYQSDDYLTGTLVLDLTDVGDREPLILHVYFSGQETPIRPSQIPKIYRRLLKERVRFNAQARRFYIVCARKFTSGTRSVASDLGITLVRDGKELINRLAEFFRNRYNKLLNALAGKRVFGPLALLVMILNKVVAMLVDPGKGFDIMLKARLIDAFANGTNVLIDPQMIVNYLA